MWRLAPKSCFSQLETFKTAVNIAVSTWNRGSDAIGDMMIQLNLEAGPNCRQFLSSIDQKRRNQSYTARNEAENDISDEDDSNEDQNYGPGIAD